MKKYLVLLLLIHSIILVNAQDSIQVISNITEQSLIDGLQNIDPEIREQSAKKIKLLLKNNENKIQKGNIVEYPTAYWLDKFNQSKPTLKREQFEDLFFTNDIDYAPNYSNVKFYQLDHFHLLKVELFKRKVKLKELTISPIFFNIDPNKTYTGTWKTYYITGSINSECKYVNGIKNGVEILYNWKGEQTWIKSYINGKVVKLLKNVNGDMVETDLKSLEIEAEME